jgi:sulfonate transport system substrate-binding protein
MSKSFRILVSTLMITLLGGTVTAVAQANELRIATQPIPQYAPIFVAKQKKWVEEELAKIGARPPSNGLPFPPDLRSTNRLPLVSRI